MGMVLLVVERKAVVEDVEEGAEDTEAAEDVDEAGSVNVMRAA
jgi:hypothetical protein